MTRTSALPRRKPAAPSRRRSQPPARTDHPPLSRRLRAPTRATPQALFDLALEKWTRGERFDIGKMAQELEVSRATLFRWCGSRELLYGEVISRLFEAALAQARQDARGSGPALIADVTRRLMTALIQHQPLRTFVQQDTEYAMRVLMSKTSTVEQRCAAAVRGALEEAVARGELRPEMKLDDLAYLIARIGESFLYRDAITGDPPEIDSAISAIRILLSAQRRPGSQGAPGVRSA